MKVISWIVFSRRRDAHTSMQDGFWERNMRRRGDRKVNVTPKLPIPPRRFTPIFLHFWIHFSTTFRHFDLFLVRSQNQTYHLSIDNILSQNPSTLLRYFINQSKTIIRFFRYTQYTYFGDNPELSGKTIWIHLSIYKSKQWNRQPNLMDIWP